MAVHQEKQGTEAQGAVRGLGAQIAGQPAGSVWSRLGLEASGGAADLAHVCCCVVAVVVACGGNGGGGGGGGIFAMACVLRQRHSHLSHVTHTNG